MPPSPKQSSSPCNNQEDTAMNAAPISSMQAAGLPHVSLSSFHCQHDPVRCSRTLHSKHYEVSYAGSPPSFPDSTPQVAIARSVRDGSPSFSVYVQQPPEQQEPLWSWAGHVLANDLKPTPTFGLGGIPQQAVPWLSKALATAGYKLTYDSPCLRFTLSGKLSPALQKALTAAQTASLQPLQQLPGETPGNLQFGQLLLQDAEVVDSTWAYKSPTSLPFIQGIIGESASVAARILPQDSKHVSNGHKQAIDVEGNDAECSRTASETVPAPNEATEVPAPVAWVVQYHDGSMGMAYTVKEYRRYGLMSMCIAQLCKHILSQQGEVYAFVVDDNEASANMMHKLGFQQAPDTWHWLGFEYTGSVTSQSPARTQL